MQHSNSTAVQAMADEQGLDCTVLIAQSAQVQVCLLITTETLAHRFPLLDLLVTLHLHLVLVQNSLQLAPGLLKVIVHLGQPLHTVSHSSATHTQHVLIKRPNFHTCWSCRCGILAIMQGNGCASKCKQQILPHGLMRVIYTRW